MVLYMYSLSTPIEKIIHDNRSVHRLKEQGFILYSDVIDITLEQLRSIPGMGEVSVQRSYEEIKAFSKMLDEFVFVNAMALVDRVGYDRAIEIMRTAE